jgi:hypothetical protein
MVSQYREPLTEFEIKFSSPHDKASYDLHMQALSKYMSLTSHLFKSPGIYVHIVSGAASLSSNSKKSYFNQMSIKSQVYILEDGKTACAVEEALEWAACDRFSPLHKGMRINPY